MKTKQIIGLVLMGIAALYISNHMGFDGVVSVFVLMSGVTLWFWKKQP